MWKKNLTPLEILDKEYRGKRSVKLLNFDPIMLSTKMNSMQLNERNCKFIKGVHVLPELAEIIDFVY